MTNFRLKHYLVFAYPIRTYSPIIFKLTDKFYHTFAEITSTSLIQTLIIFQKDFKSKLHGKLEHFWTLEHVQYYVINRLLDKNLVTHMFPTEKNVIQRSFLFTFAYRTCVHCQNVCIITKLNRKMLIYFSLVS